MPAPPRPPGACRSSSGAHSHRCLGIGPPGPIVLAYGRQAHKFSRGISVPSRERNGTMTIKVGDKLPESTFMTMGPDGAPKPMKTGELFAGKKVALFALPGAYTN